MTIIGRGHFYLRTTPKEEISPLLEGVKSPPSTIRKGDSPFLTYLQGKIIILGVLRGRCCAP
ncbi:MAG: hypothetical protein ACP5H0_05215, partial [Caldisericum sp.]|uniref:hypothetical protein n=1 Tax=Caldisericum sp. TaxID=2499687 RepID=UPI003D13C022